MDFVSQYFSEEKAGSILFAIVGVIALAIALYLFFGLKNSFARGFAIPLALVAVLELAGGATIFLRTPKDIARVASFIKNEPYHIGTIEIPRMKTVMRNFIIYRNVEMALIVISIFLLITTPAGSFWKGVATGLFMQATLVLFLDSFAERRGYTYLKHLENFKKNHETHPAPTEHNRH
jgi:hypothetical protein